MARRSILVLVLVASGWGTSTFAQSTEGPLGDYTVRTWNENDGMPAGRIRALAQDADGYLWIATDAGLVRFDGVRFESRDTFGQNRIPVGAVTALASARDRSLWVGVSGQLPLGRIKDGSLTFYGERDGFGGSYVLSLLEDGAGTIWAGTFQGLFRFAGERWQKVGQDAGLGEGSVLAIYEDRRGRLWAATATAVYRRDRGSERFEHVDIIAISSNIWQSFSEDASGTVWISDFNEGFRVPANPTRRPSAKRRGWGVKLLHDRHGNFWIGTQGQGLWRVRDVKAQSGPGIEFISVDDGLASNAVQSLLEDREGNVWLGTLAGLQRLSPHRVRPVKNLPIPRAIERTPDGSVWVGTAGGLVRFAPAGRREYTEADGVPGSVVLALYADDAGDLWVSTERGVARFSQERFSPLIVSPGPGMQRILGITGSGDTVWLRDFYQRVFRLQNEQVTLAEEIPETHRRAAASIYAGKRGNLWIGAAGGRIGVRHANGEFRSYTLDIGNIACMFEDSGGTMWIGGDDGLSRFSNDEFLTIDGKNGLSGTVKSITEDNRGSIWIGTDAGILRIERDQFDHVAANPLHQLRYRLFNTADGAAGVPFNEGSPAALRAHDGRLWFVASSGVTIIDPNELGAPPAAPPVRIESVAADARVLDASSTLALPARTSHLLIGFTALSLTDPTRVRFRYRLDGFDRGWVDAGSARQASYTNLPPRDYHFRVMASGGDGVWGDAAATLNFAIRPMFYQTRWFFVGVGLTAFVVVYASWRLHVRQVRRQFALVLAERIRMSRAIHDTLLQGLAALALQVDDLSHDSDLSSLAGKNRILRVRRQVEDYIRQARQSILDLRSPSLASRDLPQALRAAAERAIGSNPVELDVTVKGAPHSAPHVIEEQLLLIGQEAVNNAVRHGQARHVAVELDYGDDRTRLRVTDDGCGFDPDAAHRATGHYGLISMRERAEQVRGRLTISSTPGTGTEIETIIPT